MFYVTINIFLELYNVLEYYIMNEEEHYDNDNDYIGKNIMNQECYNKYMQNNNNIMMSDIGKIKSGNYIDEAEVLDSYCGSNSKTEHNDNGNNNQTVIPI